MKNDLEASHWDHAKSWKPSYKSEQKMRFRNVSQGVEFFKSKVFGQQNTLKQIGTHYKMGSDPTNFESITQSKYRDPSG